MKATEVQNQVQTDDLQMPRAPCSRKTARTSHACIIQLCTKEKEEGIVSYRDWKYIGQTLSASSTACGCNFLLARQISISWLFLRTQRAADRFMTTNMLALANAVCLIALSRSDRYIRAWLLCAWLIALCCAVVDARRQHASSRSWVCLLCELSRKRRFKNKRVRTSYHSNML